MDLKRPQLFLDDELIESTYRLQRQVHPPQMLPEPIFRPERPWEFNAVILFGTIFENRETGLLHMVYQSFAKRGRVTTGTYICLATSTDGLHWDRPTVGDVPFEGSTDNNIILAVPDNGDLLDSPSVMYDPDDPDVSRRYKLACFARSGDQRGTFVAFSRDGIHWRWHPTPVNDTGDRSNLVPARVNGRFVHLNRHARMMSLDVGTGGRSCWLSTSDDFLHWTEPKLVLAPDVADPPELQFYAMGGFPYHDQYVGWVQRLWSATDTLDVELVSSRDGMRWHRLTCRDAFVGLGPRGSWYEKWVDLPSNAPLVRNGELYWYVSGRAHSHFMGQPLPYGAIGLASQLANTMVSLTADVWEGQVTTRAIPWPGGDLRIQCAGSSRSPHLPCRSVTAAVLDADGRPIEKFTGPITMYHPGREYLQWVRVRWQDDKVSLDELTGQRIKLRIRLIEAELYALQAGPAERGGLPW